MLSHKAQLKYIEMQDSFMHEKILSSFCCCCCFFLCCCVMLILNAASSWLRVIIQIIVHAKGLFHEHESWLIDVSLLESWSSLFCTFGGHVPWSPSNYAPAAVMADVSRSCHDIQRNNNKGVMRNTVHLLWVCLLLFLFCFLTVGFYFFPQSGCELQEPTRPKHSRQLNQSKQNEPMGPVNVTSLRLLEANEM